MNSRNLYMLWATLISALISALWLRDPTAAAASALLGFVLSYYRMFNTILVNSEGWTNTECLVNGTVAIAAMVSVFLPTNPVTIRILASSILGCATWGVVLVIAMFWWSINNK